MAGKTKRSPTTKATSTRRGTSRKTRSKSAVGSAGTRKSAPRSVYNKAKTEAQAAKSDIQLLLERKLVETRDEMAATLKAHSVLILAELGETINRKVAETLQEAQETIAASATETFTTAKKEMGVT
jgi:hypothetical protein